jgi:4-amino-4-deoxy-L-arabinose transferase-like glycosyltransferase
MKQVRVTLPVTPEAYAGGRREGDGGATAGVEKQSTRSEGRRTVAVLAVTLVAYAALAFGYATLTPIWQNPDEPAHYNYVAFIAATGGLPTLQPGDWDSALLERLKNGRLQYTDSVASIRYEAWQPPLFYLAAAPLFRLGPVDDPTVIVFRLRALDIVFGALTLGMAYFVARELLSRENAVAVPLAMVGIPMFTSVSAAISADPLANLLAATILLGLVRQFRADRKGSVASMPRADLRQAGPSPAPPLPAGSADHSGLVTRMPIGTKWAIGAGVLIGLGLLTKLALGIFVPLALLTLFLRSSRPLRESAFLLGVIALVVLPWMVHQVTTYGWTDPLATSRHAAVVLDQPRFPGLSPSFLVSFLTITFHSFWAQFGWMGVVAPDRLYWAWGLLVVAALGGLAIERHRLFDDPSWRPLLATLGAAVLAYIGYNLTFEQPQGRYLFTALVPIAVLLVLGWSGWLPRRVQGWGIVLVGMGLVALNAYALMRVLVLGFASTG